MGPDGRVSPQTGGRRARGRAARRPGIESAPAGGEGDRPRAVDREGGETTSPVRGSGAVPDPPDHSQGDKPADAAALLPISPEAPGGDADRAVIARAVRPGGADRFLLLPPGRGACAHLPARGAVRTPREPDLRGRRRDDP